MRTLCPAAAPPFTPTKIQSHRRPSIDTTNRTRLILAKEMVAAKRSGCWFRLSRQERGLYSLALRLNVKFESFLLLKALTSILKKLKELGDTAYDRLTSGARLAWAFSEAAVSWGNEQARAWRIDRNYSTYLGRFFVRRDWP